MSVSQLERGGAERAQHGREERPSVECGVGLDVVVPLALGAARRVVDKVHRPVQVHARVHELGAEPAQVGVHRADEKVGLRDQEHVEQSVEAKVDRVLRAREGRVGHGLDRVAHAERVVIDHDVRERGGPGGRGEHLLQHRGRVGREEQPVHAVRAPEAQGRGQVRVQRPVRVALCDLVTASNVDGEHAGVAAGVVVVGGSAGAARVGHERPGELLLGALKERLNLGLEAQQPQRHARAPERDAKDAVARRVVCEVVHVVVVEVARTVGAEDGPRVAVAGGDVALVDQRADGRDGAGHVVLGRGEGGVGQGAGSDRAEVARIVVAAAAVRAALGVREAAANDEDALEALRRHELVGKEANLRAKAGKERVDDEERRSVAAGGGALDARDVAVHVGRQPLDEAQGRAVLLGRD
eukprot:Unigene12516_Nuclearia_a/m.38025 Unigene12516_Nuclearia_a/g.38025  ORF Unigene12516_Nuclearia_a/g.38025 Unigene12516_Nuclearia_a/m.38025 type:complete len:412 (+) Unigene12516_Nuclearia_a:127-1362(+)